MDILNVSRSKLTRELLAFFFTNADKGFYLRELERTLGFSVGNIRRQLLKFEKAGLFSSSKTGNLTYYRLNKSFPLYDEIKSIVTKTIGISGMFKEALAPVKGIETAFIYGSYAKGTEDEKSDIDLCVVGGPDDLKLMKAVKALENKLKREINYTLFSSKEFAEKAGEKGGFVNLVLKDKIIPVIGGFNAEKSDRKTAK
ncbi:MAG: nucleotidyltransferase domain-containing protein [Endomicrobiales bacterium]|nr:nucleotidyltransferase domain-containing protein [Endomicrobiales bacterium]